MIASFVDGDLGVARTVFRNVVGTRKASYTTAQNCDILRRCRVRSSAYVQSAFEPTVSICSLRMAE